MEKFDRNGLHNYIEEKTKNPYFTKKLIENIIDYGIACKNVSCDQLPEFLDKIIPEISYEEILMYCPDTILTNASRIQKYEYILNTNTRKLKTEEVYFAAKNLMKPEDIDHHGLGNGMDDLYLRKNEISDKIYKSIENKTLVTTFIDQIDHDTWYEYPFLYPNN